MNKNLKSATLLLAVLALFMASCTGAKTGNTTGETATEAEADGIKTLTLDGGVTVTWIKDNAADHSMKREIFPDATDELIADLGLADGIPASVSTFLVESGGIKVLFDTGLGADDSQLLPALASLGIAPEDVEYLYITHYHGDHIGGMMRGDTVVFPNAQVYVSRVEHEAWMAMPADKNALQTRCMEAYGSQLRMFEFGDTLPGNIVAIAAVGHTPGHTVFQAGQLLIIADIIHGAALQLNHPEICPVFDMDKEAAIEARQRILKYADENNLTMAGMHLPAPAFIESLP